MRGEGSVYQRPRQGREPSPADPWYATYYAPDPETGRPKRHNHRIPATNEQDARRELRRIRDTIDRGVIPDASSTVGTYLEYWLTLVEPDLGARTFHRYQEIVRRHLIPALGDIPLQRLTPDAIKSYYGRALRAGRLNGGPLSPQTVLHHHRILSQALQYAADQDRIDRNPCARVKPPRVRRMDKPMPEAEEVRAIIQAAKDTRWWIPVLLAVTCGMRLGEILGLQWQDVDLSAGYIRVRQSLTASNNRTDAALRLSPTKTRKARAVEIPPFLIRALTEHRERQQAEGKLPAQVVTNRDGSTGNPARWSRLWQDFVRLKGLRDITFHDLRHVQVSLLGNAGVPVAEISNRVGHSTPTQTLNRYMHRLPSGEHAAVEVLERILGEGDESPSS